MTRIILVRHGHVDWLAPKRFRGHADEQTEPLKRSSSIEQPYCLNH